MTKRKNPRSVRLDLTVEEAQTLFDICCNIGGDPVTTRRRHTDSISCKLEATGKIDDDVLNSMRDIDSLHRDIYFVEKT